MATTLSEESLTRPEPCVQHVEYWFRVTRDLLTNLTSSSDVCSSDLLALRDAACSMHLDLWR
eukprot:COSAG02_NODE_65890_length_257_cov_0.512658_1_plen_61_part_01